MEINKYLADQYPDLQVYYSWSIGSKTVHKRSILWYLLAIAAAIGMVVYAIATANFLFAIMIVLVTFIVIMRDYFPVQQIPFAITDRGIIIGGKLYQYRQFNSFYIVYEPPNVKKIYFQLRGAILPDVSVELYDKDPIAIRKLLLGFMNEDLERDDESTVDVLDRILKL